MVIFICDRFLDQRMFATCSDDSTVALWDARNLKQRIRTLQGHSNWVKNIEYSPKDGLLLTSGFDGSIYTWDINSFTENSILYTRVFHTNGLMRTRLSPDASKMLISTTSGYLIIIHNLKLSTLTQDLTGFKVRSVFGLNRLRPVRFLSREIMVGPLRFQPNMYRLMQSSQTTIPNVTNFTHLFSHVRQHNRVEFLTDFPDGDDAEIISSLQVHPQGWCALSRNVSNGEKSEVGFLNIAGSMHSVLASLPISRSPLFCSSGHAFMTYRSAMCPTRWIKLRKEKILRPLSMTSL